MASAFAPPHLCHDRGNHIVDALDLLFRRLILAARADGALERPLLVGELLDKFVPYKAAKRDGQLDSNDDYLHALMRLVAGERELIFADDLLQDDLRAELASPNPDLTVLRTYANTKIRIATARAQQILAGDTDIDLRPPTPIATPVVAPAPRASKSTEPRESGSQAITAAPDAPAAVASATVSGETAIAGTVAPTCPYCAQPIPEGRRIKFCPCCGLNLLVRRCPGCSAEIESGWKFCVTCGRKA